MSAILETENLRKYFKTPKGYLHAVEDVSISINRGETLGVVGESGCGKSTLGRTILHLLEPTGGKIYFEGQDITGAKGAELKALRKKMQIIFQDPFSSLNPRMTVGQIIGEPLKIYKLTKSKEEYNARVYELMDMVGLARRNLNSYPHEFDGGRRQRIGIGVNAQVRSMEFSAQTAAIYAGEGQAFLLGFGPGGNDGDFYRTMFRGGGEGAAWISFDNPEINELFDLASTELDAELRNEYYAEAQRLLREDMPWLWLRFTDNIFGMSKGLTGLDLDPEMYCEFRLVKSA